MKYGKSIRKRNLFGWLATIVDACRLFYLQNHRQSIKSQVYAHFD